MINKLWQRTLKCQWKTDTRIDSDSRCWKVHDSRTFLGHEKESKSHFRTSKWRSWQDNIKKCTRVITKAISRSTVVLLQPRTIKLFLFPHHLAGGTSCWNNKSLKTELTNIKKQLCCAWATTDLTFICITNCCRRWAKAAALNHFGWDIKVSLVNLPESSWESS